MVKETLKNMVCPKCNKRGAVINTISSKIEVDDFYPTLIIESIKCDNCVISNNLNYYVLNKYIMKDKELESKIRDVVKYIIDTKDSEVIDNYTNVIVMIAKEYKENKN